MLAVAALASVSAASPRETLVVNAGWLASHLSDADLVLIEVGPKSAYDAGHIPGARFVTLTDLAMVDAVTGNNLQMLPAGALHDRLAALGISDRSHVVVYCSSASIAPATRVIFTLDYAGLQNVSLLDGGVGAWTRDGHALTTDVPAPRAGTLAPLETRPIVVDAEFVKAHLNTPGFSIVDARNAGYYDGVETGGMQDSPHKAGHIPGARSVPFNTVADAKALLKPSDELAALFTRAGMKPGDTIVGYCHIGLQATATLFAARTLGYTVLLYDGSFEDWSRHADYPVEVSSVKR